jgi:hypothetical protein
VTRLSDGHDLLTTSSQPQHSASADHPPMSDSDQTSTLEPHAPAAPPYVPPPLPAYAAHDQPPVHERPRFRDRVLGMRGVIAVALASVVLGGLGGAVLGATTNGSDGRFGGRGPGGFPGRPGQFRPGQFRPGQFQPGQFQPGQQGQFQGQVPRP